MPLKSSLQTSFLPSQQFCEALTVMTPPSGYLAGPPSGSWGAPQILPTPLQDWPLSHRPDPTASGRHCTVPLGLMPPPQQELFIAACVSPVQKSPVSRHPLAGWQTVAPEPGSTQTREQQFVPPEHGLPSWMHPPPPPPLMAMQTPGPPSVVEQTLPQQSLPLKQMSPVA